jgi:hypothetical protein
MDAGNFITLVRILDLMFVPWTRGKSRYERANPQPDVRCDNLLTIGVDNKRSVSL